MEIKKWKGKYVLQFNMQFIDFPTLTSKVVLFG